MPCVPTDISLSLPPFLYFTLPQKPRWRKLLLWVGGRTLRRYSSDINECLQKCIENQLNGECEWTGWSCHCVLQQHTGFFYIYFASFCIINYSSYANAYGHQMANSCLHYDMQSNFERTFMWYRIFGVYPRSLLLGQQVNAFVLLLFFNGIKDSAVPLLLLLLLAQRIRRVVLLRTATI